MWSIALDAYPEVVKEMLLLLGMYLLPDKQDLRWIQGIKENSNDTQHVLIPLWFEFTND